MDADGIKYIDRSNPQKLYLQLFEALKNLIENGHWKPEDKIPTEVELCEQYNVSKATVRLALSELERQGYIKRQQGKGTFVCKREQPDGIAMLINFKEDFFEEGLKFSTRLLAQTVMMPIDGIDIKLAVSADKHIIYVKRLKLLNAEPVFLQEIFLPHFMCPSLLSEDITMLSITELIEKKCKRRVTKVEEFISVEHINKKDGELLSISKGTPVLLTEQFFYEGPQRIAFVKSLNRADKLKLFIELRRFHYNR